MDTITCTACGKQIPADAVRCIYCRHIQGFSHQKPDDEIIHNKPADIPQSSHDQKADGVEPLDVEKGGKDVVSTKYVPPAEGKLKRLNSILTGKSAEPDLDALRREGLLPGEGSVKQDTTSVKGDNQESNLVMDGLPPPSILPTWLRSAAILPVEKETPKVDDHNEIEPAASLGELPDWVQRLKDKIQNRDNMSQTDGLAVTPIEQKETTDPLRITGAKQRKPLPVLDFHEPDNQLIESVTAYLGGLKSSRKIPADRDQRLSRRVWGVIGLAMFSLAAALLWSGSAISTNSQPAVADLATMTTYIDLLSPESVVLMGMDYDVSLAGEIDNAALPVLVHLMRKQINLVFVSTRPTGPALSDHLIDLGMTWLPEYPVEKAFVFPFLPGEAAGLLQLATKPRQALTIELDGSNPWTTPELSGIQDISDFSLVVLLSDSAGSGRDWIEQVQPRLFDVPLFAIVSKQAAPTYLPYRESGQLQALAAGISDGVSYERVYLLTTNNQQMLRAYQGVLLFMATLLACVILLSVFPHKIDIKPARRSRKNASR